MSDHSDSADDTGPDRNELMLQRDLALRQARLAEAGLKVIRMALNENRPLEALYTSNNELERLEEELDGLESLGEVADGE